MFKNINKLRQTYKTRKNWMIETDIKEYSSILDKIKSLNYKDLGDSSLKELSKKLISRVQKGTSVDDLLVEAYALVTEVSKRVLGLQPFDKQIMAGIAMHQGKLVEMQTGEGKTLVAVFPAYLNAITGKGVHVLTFNDYLAHRDAEWMGPIYKFLGLTVGFIQEEMNTEERRKAYAADITYVTAKEAGFDYLRGFLCYEREELVHRQFNFAIVDEADSILIDEARVPLVIAGSISEKECGQVRMAEIAKKLELLKDYGTDEYVKNVYLTESGVARAEDLIKCKNLYSSENVNLLTELYCALHAEALLKRDVDYIVREGKVELVDEFTGRIAENRHWPDGLQAAVEAKESLFLQDKGRILGSITLQSFIQVYPKLSGMTATAQTSAEELLTFYKITVVVIPPNRPCIRIDHPDIVFTHKGAKHKALVHEITEINSTGRPILVGTSSIEESEKLADLLKQEGIKCSVLNAKNDEFEAKIISNAGALGSVTVSTNMAGRGTDIRLGGEKEEERDRVVKLGGLYVIGTNRHESRRIDNQLRGRAGRQGDPGSSRFFISLEDDLIKRYGIEKTIPTRYLPKKQEVSLDSPVINQRIAHVQRIVEGQNFDMRKTLWNYSFIIEEQRKVVHKRRQDLLFGKAHENVLSQLAPEKYSELVSHVDEDTLNEVEKQISLFNIDECWADYLAQVAYIREGIHLVRIGRMDPVQEFHVMTSKAFDDMQLRLEEEIARTFNSVRITQDGLDMEGEGLKRPSSTWTYMVNDNPFADNFSLFMSSNSNIGFATMGILIEWPIILGATIFSYFMKKKKLKE